MSTPDATTPHAPLTVAEVGELFADAPARWWLSGGAALDRWLGEAIRERPNIDVSVVPRDLDALVAALPAHYSAWAPAGQDTSERVPLAEAPEGADLQPVRVYDEQQERFVLQINIEDGTEKLWLYRRDPRLQLPWNEAILDLDGIPTGAPQIQLVWKTLRPRPEDELDKDAVLPKLDEPARAWWERAVLSIHPHSTWAIHVRSPFAPAKASWNRKRRPNY